MMKLLRMQALLTSAVFLFFVVAVSLAAPSSSAAEVSFQTGFNYEWLNSTKDWDAQQFYVPIRMDVRMGDFTLAALTAYTSTHIDTAEVDGTLSTSLDTKIMSSYEIIGKLPVDVILGLDLNLPTGKTDLKEKDLAFILDSDIISINNFGEGFNVNPTLTIAKQWTGGAVGLGLGYVFRGEYDYSSEIGMNDYDPGDVFNVNAEFRKDLSANAYGRIFGGYLWFDDAKAGGQKIYQEGSVPIAGVGVGYKGKRWGGGLSVHGIFREKSSFQNESGGLSTEEKNSHGTEWIADLSMKYLVNDKTTLSSLLRGLIYSKNDYPSESDRFIGKRSKVSLGLQVNRLLSRTVEAAFIAKGFYMHADEANFPEPKQAQDYRGLSGGIQLTARF